MHRMLLLMSAEWRQRQPMRSFDCKSESKKTRKQNGCNVDVDVFLAFFTKSFHDNQLHDSCIEKHWKCLDKKTFFSGKISLSKVNIMEEESIEVQSHIEDNSKMVILMNISMIIIT